MPLDSLEKRASPRHTAKTAFHMDVLKVWLIGIRGENAGEVHN